MPSFNRKNSVIDTSRSLDADMTSFDKDTADANDPTKREAQAQARRKRSSPHRGTPELSPASGSVTPRKPLTKCSPHTDPDKIGTPITNARRKAKVPQLYLTAGSTPPPTNLLKNKARHKTMQRVELKNLRSVQDKKNMENRVPDLHKRQKVDSLERDVDVYTSDEDSILAPFSSGVVPLLDSDLDEDDADESLEVPSLPAVVTLISDPGDDQKNTEHVAKDLGGSNHFRPNPITQSDIISSLVSKPVRQPGDTTAPTPPLFSPEKSPETNEGSMKRNITKALMAPRTSETSLIGEILSRPSMGGTQSDEDTTGEISQAHMDKRMMKSLKRIDPAFITSKPCDPARFSAANCDSGKSAPVALQSGDLAPASSRSTESCGEVIMTSPGSEEKEECTPEETPEEPQISQSKLEATTPPQVPDREGSEDSDRYSAQLSRSSRRTSAPDRPLSMQRLRSPEDSDRRASEGSKPVEETYGMCLVDDPPPPPAPVEDLEPAAAIRRKPPRLTNSTGYVSVEAVGPGYNVDVGSGFDTDRNVQGKGHHSKGHLCSSVQRGRCTYQTNKKTSPPGVKVEVSTKRSRRSISEPRGRSDGPGGLAGSAVYKAHNAAFFTINPSILEDVDVWDVVHLRRLCLMLGIDDDNCHSHRAYVGLLLQWNRNPNVLLHPPEVTTNYHAGLVNAYVCNFNHMPIMRSKLPKRYRSIVDPLPKELQLHSALRKKGHKKKRNRIKFSPYNHMLSFDLSSEERYDKKLCLYEIASMQSLEHNEAGVDADVILLDPTRELAGDPDWEIAKKNMLDNLRRTSMVDMFNDPEHW